MNRIKLFVGLLVLIFVVLSALIIGAVQSDPGNVGGLRTVSHVLIGIWAVILVGVGIGLVYSLHAALAYRRMMRPVAEMVNVMQESGLTTEALVHEFEGLFQQSLFEATQDYLAAGQPLPENIGESVIERASAEMQHKYGLTADHMARVIMLFARMDSPAPDGAPDVTPGRRLNL